MMEKVALYSRIVFLAAAAAVLILAAGLNSALAQTATHGGLIHVGKDEIASVVTDQGKIVSGDALKAATDVAQNDTPQLIDPPAAGFALAADDFNGTYTKMLNESPGRMGETIALPGEPVLQPYADPGNLGLDVTTPGKNRVHLSGSRDSVMLIKSSAADAYSSAPKGARQETGIVMVSFKGYKLIVMDNYKNLANTANAAIKAAKNNNWKNTAAEACLAVDGGQKIILSVPPGTISGWNPDVPYGKCPVAGGGKGPAGGNGVMVAAKQGGKTANGLLKGSKGKLPHIPGVRDIKNPGKVVAPLAHPEDLINSWLPQLPDTAGLPQLPQVPPVSPAIPSLPVGVPQLPQSLPAPDTSVISQLPPVDSSTISDVEGYLGSVNVPDTAAPAARAQTSVAADTAASASTGGNNSAGLRIDTGLGISAGAK